MKRVSLGEPNKTKPDNRIIGLFGLGRPFMWHVYICSRSGQLYTGITTNLGHRMKQHKAILLYSETYPDKFQAAKRECQIKGWTHKKKQELIDGNKVSLR